MASTSGWCGPTIIATVFYAMGVMLEIGSIITDFATNTPIQTGKFVGSFLFYSIISLFWIGVYYFFCANNMAWVSWTILVLKLLFAMGVMLLMLAVMVAVVQKSKHEKNIATVKENMSIDKRNMIQQIKDSDLEN